MTIIDLASERDKRDGPDPEFVTTDECGRKMFAFRAEYRIDGSTFGIHFFAYDFGDAERRILAMRETLSLSGQIYCEV
ncbi:hypothetical protein [Rhizobium rhizogenes]|uniref:hypothetical protein n=1 Tax=Rhizobium rhizogenes TaxID=359 RepID=UPI001572AA86|nr:hypothetical protein [Rhizobium rhizogenes]NTG94246.1 hypothetical protein [Rhizobium rhizogenes]